MRESLSESERKVIVLRIKRVARFAKMLGLTPVREMLPLSQDERKDLR